MLTFLRKIRRSLIESGNARKYLLYAIGEIALVVIGILIALQINNWNEHRKNRLQEQTLLKGLYAELEENHEQLDRILAMKELSLNSYSLLIPQFKLSSPSIAEDSLFRLWINAVTGSLSTFDPRLGFIKSTINSGKTSLIQNKELIKIISQFEDQAIDAGESTAWNIQIWNSYLFKATTQYIPILYGKPFGFSPKFRNNFNAFFNNALIEAHIRQRYTYLDNGLSEERELKASIERMLAIIESEMEKKEVPNSEISSR